MTIILYAVMAFATVAILLIFRNVRRTKRHQRREDSSHRLYQRTLRIREISLAIFGYRRQLRIEHKPTPISRDRDDLVDEGAPR
jgi:hypothetical protein